MMSPSPSIPLTWPDLLAAAQTPAEVIGVVRDFIALWTPEEIAALPGACRLPGKFLEPEDVVLYTYTLVEHQLKAEREDPGVFRMSSFFSEATRRVTQLMGETPPKTAANADELEA